MRTSLGRSAARRCRQSRPSRSAPRHARAPCRSCRPAGETSFCRVGRGGARRGARRWHATNRMTCKPAEEVRGMYDRHEFLLSPSSRDQSECLVAISWSRSEAVGTLWCGHATLAIASCAFSMALATSAISRLTSSSESRSFVCALIFMPIRLKFSVRLVFRANMNSF
jgi:hypothetical protein